MSSAKILIAEDSRTQRETLRAHLEAAGYEVTVACDGAAALAQLEDDSIALLVSDIVMPVMNGYELCREAKRCRPHLPVVLLTSMTDPLDVVRALQVGADNFLRKPYDVKLLLARVQAILRNQELRRANPRTQGLELLFRGERFTVTAGRQQILDLLVSTFEDLITANDHLRDRERELDAARAELEIRLAEADRQRRRLWTVLSAVPEPMAVVDTDGRLTGSNQAFAALSGVASPKALYGAPVEAVLRLFHHNGEALEPDHYPIRRAATDLEPVQAGRCFDLLVGKRGDVRVPVMIHAAPIIDDRGKPAGAVGILYELEALSLHDPLTCLPGHQAFAAHVEAAVEASAFGPEVTAVLVATVDRRHVLRESLGSSGTDRLVAMLAEDLRVALHTGVVTQQGTAAGIAYLGEMEFAVVLPGLRDETQGVLMAQEILRQLVGLRQVDDVDIPVSLSIGISITSGANTKAEDLVPAAAAAARLGSERGGGRVTGSDPAVARRAAGQLRDEAELRRAIENRELAVYYQPVVTMHGRLAGVEALVRWPEEGGRVRSPAEFIPLAEETGLIVPLGWDVLEQACHQMAAWRKGPFDGIETFVSVNLSPQQLRMPDMCDRVEHALAASGLPPQALSLEITESGVIEEADTAFAQLRRLRDTGVGVAIDDFGTGYSSLLQLRKLPVDTLKIDRAFVDGLGRNPDDTVIVSASLSMAHALQLKVVAEGVERPDQAAHLRKLGCDLAQGYLWSRPLDALDLLRWFEQQNHPGDTPTGA